LPFSTGCGAHLCHPPTLAAAHTIPFGCPLLPQLLLKGSQGKVKQDLPATTEAKLVTADPACVALLPEECGFLWTKAGLLLRRWSQETVIA